MLSTLGIVQLDATGDGLESADRLAAISRRRFGGKPLHLFTHPLIELFGG